MFTKVMYNLHVAIAADLRIAHLLGRQEKRGIVCVSVRKKHLFNSNCGERIHHLHFNEPNSVRMNGYIYARNEIHIFVIRLTKSYV